MGVREMLSSSASRPSTTGPPLRNALWRIIRRRVWYASSPSFSGVVVRGDAVTLFRSLQVHGIRIVCDQIVIFVSRYHSRSQHPDGENTAIRRGPGPCLVPNNPFDDVHRRLF